MGVRPRAGGSGRPAGGGAGPSPRYSRGEACGSPVERLSGLKRGAETQGRKKGRYARPRISAVKGFRLLRPVRNTIQSSTRRCAFVGRREGSADRCCVHARHVQNATHSLNRLTAAVQRPSSILPKAQAFDFSTADDYLDKARDCGLVPAATVGVAIGLRAPVLASML